ncbi:C4-type zinc ribbon domain-containing protein [Aquiluna sp.]|nr:C4-type zinc ribbon domain-containing protein [Aquiluna sp.]MDA9099548.1 C4-type zinc ribbon domain-containing protein [Aquiluna sp.]
MKIDSNQLPELIRLQQLLVEATRLDTRIRQLQTGESAEAIRVVLLEQSAKASQMLADHEEVERDVRRAEADLELVENRISKDKQRLAVSSDSKVITGIQHELESLAKRQGELEEAQLILMESIDQSNLEQEAIQLERMRLQAELSAATESAALDIANLSTELSTVNGEMAEIRKAVSAELVELFDKIRVRGTAVGKLKDSTCGACNMNLTSTAVGQLSAVPNDELARCPECSAILVI